VPAYAANFISGSTKNGQDHATGVDLPLNLFAAGRAKDALNANSELQLDACLALYRENSDEHNRLLLIGAINQVLGDEEMAQRASELVTKAIEVLHSRTIK